MLLSRDAQSAGDAVAEETDLEADRDRGLPEALASRWRSLLLVPLVCGGLAWLLTFLMTSYYTSSTTFITESNEPTKQVQGFAGVAAQLGLSGSLSPSNSPQFFADILRSRSVVAAVLSSRVPDVRTPGAKDSLVILDLYAPKSGEPSFRLDKGITELRKRSSVSVNPRTNMIEFLVAAPHPIAAKLVAQRFLDVLGTFNLKTRQTQARERLRFISSRLAEAHDSLARQESAQEYFLQTNRTFRDAPALQAQFERIQRQLSVYQEIYLTVRREYETARVDVINDTPVITIVDSATVPLRRSSPQRGTTAVVGALLGAFLALSYLLGRVSVARLRRTDPAGYLRLLAVRQLFRRSLRLTSRRY